MSTDPSTAAFAQLDAPAEESRAPAAARPLDLAALAAALAQIEALLAGGAEGAEGAAAIERIADIAFVLHERDIEPSLCDALDDAVREIGVADALKRASLQRAREAAALLRELSHALDAMVAADIEQPQPAATIPETAPLSNSVATVQESQEAATAADELAAPAGLFDVEMPEDDAFALTIAALAATLPNGAGTAPADFQHETGEPVASPQTLTHCEQAADEEPIEAFQSEEAIASGSLAEADLHQPMSGALSVAAVDADVGGKTSEDAVLPEVPLNEPNAASGGGDTSSWESGVAAVESAAPAPGIASVEPAWPDATSIDALWEPSAQEAVSTTQSEAVAATPAEMQPSINPDEDPGDLFEPAADARPPSMATAPTAPAALAAPSSDGEAAGALLPLAALPPTPAASAEVVEKPPLPASAAALRAAAPAHATLQPAAIDPLAPIRALSDEELIALFS